MIRRNEESRQQYGLGRISSVLKFFSYEKHRVVFIRPVTNEKGLTIVIAILFLALLTSLGIAALNTSTTEIRISGNEREYQQAFYNADTGVSYAIEQGLALYPAVAPDVLTTIPTPADLAANNIQYQFMYKGSVSGRELYELYSTGLGSGTGRALIIAGISNVPLSPPGGPGVDLF